MLVFPYLSRVLGPAQFGAVALAHSLMVYVQSITDCGFKLTATRDIAAHRHDKAQIDEIFSSVMYVRLALTALAALAVFLLISFVPRFRADPWLYYFSFGFVVGNVLWRRRSTPMPKRACSPARTRRKAICPAAATQ